MINERAILCGGVTTRARVGRKDPVRLLLWGNDRNIELKITDITDKMVTNLPGYLIDLLEIAAYVYCADQAITRGGNGVRDYGKNWRRHLHFYIPVRQPELWSKEEVTESLSKTLGFLSDDFYYFKFSKLQSPPAIESYLDLDPVEVTGIDPKEVLLFSGGLDSLAGAIHEIENRNREVVLVSHRSARKIVSKQKRLVADLKSRCKVAPFHVPVWVHKIGTKLSKDNSQRSRTFLYASLATVVARIFNLSKIRFYENGIVSINLPICEQVIGARATRTTHPKVLNGFSDLFSKLFDIEFTVDNPFLWKTKTDVVQSIIDSGFRDLIKHTVSCAHVFKMTSDKTHCGTCSQCIDRRFATLASGCKDGDDPASAYRVNLMTDELKTHEQRTMIESYVRTMREMKNYDDDEFFSKYPESTRVIGHIKDLQIDEAATNVLDLYRRHSKQVNDVLVRNFAEHADDINEGRLSDSCLTIIALPDRYKNQGMVEIPSDECPEDLCVFQKKGDYWHAAYNGTTTNIRHCKGMAYIAELIKNPGIEIHAATLRGIIEGSDDIPILGSAGETIDRKATVEYRKKLVEIEEEKIQATDDGDIGRVEILTEKYERIYAEISRATGMRGEIRKDSDDQERARQSVTKAIGRAMKKIEVNHEPLWKHLHSSLTLGAFLQYQPEQPTNWKN